MRHILFIILVLSFAFSLQLQAAQIAIIRPEKAVVYADVQAKAPIGYVSQGKTIQVGDVPKYNNTVVATVVQDKIAYVKTKDIFLVEEYNYEEIRDTQISGDLKDYLYEAKFRNKSSFYASLGAYQLGSSWKRLSKTINEKDTNQLGNYLKVRYERHPFFFDKLTAGIGIDHYRISDNRLKFVSTGIALDLSFNLYNYEYFFLEVFGSLFYAPKTQMDIVSNQIEISAIGTQLGFAGTRYFDSGWGIRGGLGHQTIATSSLDNINLGANEGFQTINVSDFNIAGLHIFLSVLYRL